MLAKWVNAAQLIEGRDKQTYLVLKGDELPEVTPMNGPIESDWSIYPKKKNEDESN